MFLFFLKNSSNQIVHLSHLLTMEQNKVKTDYNINRSQLSVARFNLWPGAFFHRLHISTFLPRRPPPCRRRLPFFVHFHNKAPTLFALCVTLSDWVKIHPKPPPRPPSSSIAICGKVFIQITIQTTPRPPTEPPTIFQPSMRACSGSVTTVVRNGNKLLSAKQMNI